MGQMPFLITDYEAPVILVDAYCVITSSLATGLITWGTFQLVGGTVNIDRSNTVRRTATNVTYVPYPGGDPAIPTAGLADGIWSPYGNEMTIYKGILDPVSHAVLGYAQLGVFVIEEVDVVMDGTGLTLVGSMKDRATLIERLEFPWPFQTGLLSEDAVDVVAEILENVWDAYYGVTSPIPTGSWSPVGYIPPVLTYKTGDDPWKAMTDIAAAVGYALYFDYAGVLQFQPVPDPSSLTSVVTYAEGTTTSPVKISRAINNDQVPNVIAVEASGSNTGDPSLVYWWDSNSTSPTYYAPASSWPAPVYALPNAAGNYPTLVSHFSSTMIGPNTVANPNARDEQATAMAIAIGLTSVGSLEKATYSLRDQPAHDVDDRVTITVADANVPTVDYVIDQVKIEVAYDGGVEFTGRPIYA